jgi:hypothetical protein
MNLGHCNENQVTNHQQELVMKYGSEEKMMLLFVPTQKIGFTSSK